MNNDEYGLNGSRRDLALLAWVLAGGKPEDYIRSALFNAPTHDNARCVIPSTSSVQPSPCLSIIYDSTGFPIGVKEYESGENDTR